MAVTPDIKPVKGGVLAAEGFRAAGVYAGIKTDKSKRDVGLLVADSPVNGAVTLTTNRVKAAPVKWCRKVLQKRKQVRAVAVNSGNANACTGPRGAKDTAETADALAGLIGCKAGEILVASTGIIGEFLPMQKISSGISKSFRSLGSSPAAAGRFADSILTTDTVRKECAVRVTHRGKSFYIGGCSKGAGMIGPNMATMLSFITTDAHVDSATLRRSLKKAVQQSFNSIIVDGHTSTNDTVILLAGGKSGTKIFGKSRGDIFQTALNLVTLELAKSIVRDGEGATKLVRIDVTGAESHAAARTIAVAMARSPLNMTAIHGGDPNWGRFISSAGYAGPNFVEEKAKLFIGDKLVYRFGRPADTPTEELNAAMRKTEIHLLLSLGLGRGKSTVWACDLSRDYITINADYHT